jgi:branched-subunit amino acid aminotransferase/4-amino-4-deoxychorismate lyase
MSMIIFRNGELLAEDLAMISVNDRAFRYGDGFFETFRYQQGRVIFIEAHWQRLCRTAKFMHLQLPSDLTLKGIETHARDLCEANEIAHARIRLQLNRAGSGKYRPASNLADWTMTCSPLEDTSYALSSKGLTIGSYAGCPVSSAPLGNHKTLNALPYVLASIYAQEHGWDDALLLNSAGQITEATSSNLFLIKEKEILTADLSKGGLPGVMRAKLMEVARSNGFQVSISAITEKEMLWADECLLTNVISGIRWVLAYRQKRYFHRTAEVLVHELNKSAGLI